MFLVLFIVLLLAWLMGFVAFHVAGGLIHLLLIVAFISLIVHFVGGRRGSHSRTSAMRVGAEKLRTGGWSCQKFSWFLRFFRLL